MDLSSLTPSPPVLDLGSHKTDTENLKCHTYLHTHSHLPTPAMKFTCCACAIQCNTHDNFCMYPMIMSGGIHLNLSCHKSIWPDIIALYNKSNMFVEVHQVSHISPAIQSSRDYVSFSVSFTRCLVGAEREYLWLTLWIFSIHHSSVAQVASQFESGGVSTLILSSWSRIFSPRQVYRLLLMSFRWGKYSFERTNTLSMRPLAIGRQNSNSMTARTLLHFLASTAASTRLSCSLLVQDWGTAWYTPLLVYVIPFLLH